MDNAFDIKKHYYTIPNIIGKVKLLRAIYPYLKILKKSPYVQDRKLHYFTFNVSVDHRRFDAQGIYTYQFNFKPYIAEDNHVTFEISLDIFTDKVQIKILRDSNENGISNVRLLSDIIFNESILEVITLEDFEDRILNVHDKTINLIVNANGKKSAISVLQKYIPKEVLEEEKYQYLINSLTAVKKYNL